MGSVLIKGAQKLENRQSAQATYHLLKHDKLLHETRFLNLKPKVAFSQLARELASYLLFFTQ